MAFLIDTDAFLCLRHLGLLELVLPRLPAPILLGEYVARHELSTLDALVRQMEREGRANVAARISVGRGREKFRELVRGGADKGEAEALAWASLLETPPLFISLDVRARRIASTLRVPETDIMGFIVEVIAMGCLTEAEATAATAPWNDRRQEFCRPPDFDTFELTLQRRQRSRKG